MKNENNKGFAKKIAKKIAKKVDLEAMHYSPDNSNMLKFSFHALCIFRPNHQKNHNQPKTVSSMTIDAFWFLSQRRASPPQKKRLHSYTLLFVLPHALKSDIGRHVAARELQIKRSLDVALEQKSS